MNKYLIIIAILLATFSSMFAEDKKVEIMDKEVHVQNFEKVLLLGSDKIVFTLGDKPSVRIHGIKQDVEAVIINQSGKTLEVSRKNTFNNGRGLKSLLKEIWNGTEHEGVVVYVTSPDLTEVTLTGSGDFVAKGKIDTDNLKITLKGSGDMVFNDIICDKIDVTLTGSGDIDINNVESLSSDVQLRGSGDVEIKQFNVLKTSLSLYGSGDIDVNCEKCGSVKASLVGSGDITITGQFKLESKSVSGSGDLHIHNK